MGQILLPKQYHPDFATPGKKPIGPVEIDWDNPLAQGLVYFWHGGMVNHNATTGVGEQVVGGAVRKVLNLPFAGSIFNSANFNGVGGSSGRTVVVHARHGAFAPSNFSDAQAVGWGVNSAGELFDFGVNTSSGQGPLGNMRLSVASGFAVANGPSLNDGGQHIFAVSVSGNVNQSRFALDGALHGINDSGARALNSSVTTQLTIGSDAANKTGGSWYGTAAGTGVGLALVFDRELSDVELHKITADPYQIFKPAIAQLYNFPSAVGADHDLLADNLQSVSSVSTPDVGQEHAILADDLQSLSQLSTPVVGQEHAILADNLQSVSEVETVSVGQEHVLLADDLQSLSQLSTPTATEVSADHTLLADDLQSLSEVGTPTVGQEHAVLADDLESDSSLSTPTVGQEHVLLSDSLQSLSQLSTPAVVEDTVNELLADDLESVSEVGTATIAQIHVLLSDSLQSVSSLSTPAVVSVSVPLIDGATSQVINTNGGSLDLYFNGTDYFEVA